MDMGVGKVASKNIAPKVIPMRECSAANAGRTLSARYTLRVPTFTRGYARFTRSPPAVSCRPVGAFARVLNADATNSERVKRVTLTGVSLCKAQRRQVS